MNPNEQNCSNDFPMLLEKKSLIIASASLCFVKATYKQYLYEKRAC